MAKSTWQEFDQSMQDADAIDGVVDTMAIAKDKAGIIVDDLRALMNGNTGNCELKDSTAAWLEKRISDEIWRAYNVGAIVELRPKST